MHHSLFCPIKKNNNGGIGTCWSSPFLASKEQRWGNCYSFVINFLVVRDMRSNKKSCNKSMYIDVLGLPPCSTRICRDSRHLKLRNKKSKQQNGKSVNDYIAFTTWCLPSWVKSYFYPCKWLWLWKACRFEMVLCLTSNFTLFHS